MIDARDENCGIIIALDANAKLGSSIIKGDPNMMSSNGQILLNLLQRQNLTVANASEKCKGTITRHRTTVDREEKAVLDFLIFCDKIGPLFEKMTIDESRTYVLKKFVTTRGLDSKVESDHNQLEISA